MINKIIKVLIVFSLIIGLQGSAYYNVPDTFDSGYGFVSGNEQRWDWLGQQLINTKESVIYLYWKGYGGDVSMMLHFVDAMRIAQSEGKQIIFILVGEAYSAHADAACYADQVQNNDRYFLMYHPLANWDDKVLNDPLSVWEGKKILQKCVDKGILTYEAMLKSLTVNEVYVYYRDNQYIRYYRLDPRL